LAPTEITLNPFLKRKIVAIYETNAGQTLEAAVAEIVIYEDKIYDPLNLYNTSTGVLTCPFTSIYHMNGNIAIDNAIWTAGDLSVLSIRKGASTTVRSQLLVIGTLTGATYKQIAKVSCLGSLAQSDTIDVFYDHNRTGGDVALTTTEANNYFEFYEVL
jgi:hypothetical protein